MCFWPDSERTIAGTETNNTSCESPNTQLLGAASKGVWHYCGDSTPTSRKNSTFWGKVGVCSPCWCHTLPCPLKYQMTHQKEPENGSRSNQNTIFLSEMIVYFRPTCAGWPYPVHNWSNSDFSLITLDTYHYTLRPQFTNFVKNNVSIWTRFWLL